MIKDFLLGMTGAMAVIAWIRCFVLQAKGNKHERILRILCEDRGINYDIQ